MTKFLQKLFFPQQQQNPPLQPTPTVFHTEPPAEMAAFTQWCKELNVGARARQTEITVIIGDHTKYVVLHWNQ